MIKDLFDKTELDLEEGQEDIIVEEELEELAYGGFDFTENELLQWDKEMEEYSRNIEFCNKWGLDYEIEFKKTSF